ncbi:MAG: Crp/Fnr family transcriptional regulator [Leptolyngbya sp. SIOISBB]|nr:Crp/Fnr family transcriptional regulator [Leptolyngbya sp. SIOISBB]
MKTTPLIQKLFINHGQTRKLSKKYSLLYQGEVSRYAYFVKSGCLRMWYNDCDNDITVKFFIPGDVVASLESFYQETPSKFGLESIVPTVVMAVSKTVFTEQLDISVAFKDEILAISISCMADYQNLFLNRIMTNPEERFRLLMEQSPQLFQLIPHHYIASYLGITPVSLSRIRKRVESINNC